MPGVDHLAHASRNSGLSGCAYAAQSFQSQSTRFLSPVHEENPHEARNHNYAQRNGISISLGYQPSQCPD